MVREVGEDQGFVEGTNWENSKAGTKLDKCIADVAGNLSERLLIMMMTMDRMAILQQLSQCHITVHMTQ